MELDLTLINKIIDRTKIKNLYILDSSAIFGNPQIDAYYEKYSDKVNNPAIYIITTTFLKELDDVKNKGQNTRRGHYTFMEKIRKYCNKGKLSEGQEINEFDYIFFYPINLKEINDHFEWLPNDYPDKQLINLALGLKEKIKDARIGILSGDSLIKILCKEKSLEYIYIPDEPTERQEGVEEFGQYVTKYGDQVKIEELPPTIPPEWPPITPPAGN